jgi:hypothetical protein
LVVASTSYWPAEWDLLHHGVSDDASDDVSRPWGLKLCQGPVDRLGAEFLTASW